jgi:hypothetical protein
MKYLENAVKYLIKNWILAVPLFILVAIPALITGTADSLGKITEVWTALSNPAQLSNLTGLFTTLGLILPLAVGGGILAFLFQFISIPLTYGLINKGLETGNASLNDIGMAVSTNFVKYVMYFAGTLVLSLAFSVASLIILGIFMLIRLYFVIVLLILVLALAALVLSILLSFWFSAMVVDNLDVIAAARKSIEIAKSCFWTIIGIAILVAIAGGIAGAILGLLKVIPLLGPIIASAIPAATTFLMMVFYLLVYREKTGRFNSVQL